MSQLLFVYGTLKKDKSNHSVLGKAKFVGQGTVGGYDLYTNGYYPYALWTGSDDGYIYGEVYEIDDESFARCDRLEGYPDHYNRKEVFVDMGDAYCEGETAWIYYVTEDRINTTKLRKLEDGVFQ